MIWVNSTKLVQWADTKVCEGKLPELIRKLIIASCSDFPEISLPVGDSIYKKGWDGTCNCKEESLFVPEGLSLWEFGRNNKIKDKAEKDFIKRTSLTDEETRKESTFIFVSPRRWDGKKEWLEAKKAEKQWKNVKVYDADDLECWLETLPAVGVWLAKELGIPTAYIESAHQFWNNWIENPHLNFSPELIISGRLVEQKRIQHFLDGEKDILEVQASSKEEAVGFVIASVLTKEGYSADTFFSKAIIISNKIALKEISMQRENLIIIYNSESDDIVSKQKGNSNHIISVISYEVKSSGVTIPISKWDDFIKSIENLGIERQNANSLGKECGRSFSVLKRILSNKPGRVEWNEGNNLLELIPIFFIQKFDELKEGDIEIIQRLANEDYQNYKVKLKKWSLISDNPIYQIDNHWRLVSSYDLLHVFSKYLTEEHLYEFEKVFYEVLGEINPALELELDKRYAAALFNKDRKYSDRIREGLCQTLLILAVHGESSGVNVRFSIQAWADRLIQNILSNKELSFWQSIQNKLHLLAEASPKSFLFSFDALIKKEPAVISSMFDDRNYGFFSPSYHTHILWSLELLAWEPNNLTRITLVLAELVILDEGDKLSNRPINTLASIFMLWLPQTFANFGTRKQTIETLIKRKPEVAFKLLKEISPNSHTTSSYNYQPIWRMREFSSSRISRKEYAEGISFVNEKLIELMQDNADMWSDIIDLIDDFVDVDRTRLISSALKVEMFKGDIDKLREKLRLFIFRHETYSERDWAITSKELKELKTLYDKITLNDIDKYYWYFNVDTIENRRTVNLEYREIIKSTNEKRVKLLESITAALGINGILELIQKVDRSEIVGYYLPEINPSLESQILKLLSCEYDKKHYLAVGYLKKQAEIRGIEWIKSTALLFLDNSELQLCFFLSIQPFNEVWDLIENEYPTIKERYWPLAFKRGREFGGSYYSLSVDDKIRCIKTLNQYNRYLTSLCLIQYERQSIPADLIVEMLEGFATNQTDDDDEYDAWTIVQLFKRLDEEGIDDNKMLLLEWYYIEVFRDYGNNRPLKHLNAALKRNPAFFAEVILCLYKPENRSAEEEVKGFDVKAIATRAKRADRLLEYWNDFPGETENDMNYAELQDWINQAIIECEKKDRKKRGSYQIGKMLGKTYLNMYNSPWPSSELCELLESLENEEIDSGFEDGIREGRGIRHLVGGADGGRNDLKKGDTFKALSESVAHTYPKVATLLEKVANNYFSWAKFQEKREKQEELDD